MRRILLLSMLLLFLLCGVGLLVMAGTGVSMLISGGAKFSFAPAMSTCILVPGIIAALVMSGMLYREQRRMASLRVVLLLTALRMMLIVLLAILFLQPALRWEWVKTSAGTLWLVLDQSPSMQTNDPQATEAEKLHWAEGMGYLKRPVRPDELATQVHVLADEIAGMVPDASSGAGGDEEKRQIDAFADRLTAWAKEAEKLAGEVQDAGVPAAESDLTQAASQARKDSGFVRRAANLRAARIELHGNEIGVALVSAEKQVREKAADVDRTYLRDKKGSTELTAAQSRVDAANRAAIAYGVLGGSDAEGARLLSGLTRQYHIRIANFSDKAETAALVDSGSLDDALKSSLVPAGQSTNMASALQFVAEQVQGGEAASVIVVSDGRSNTGPDPSGVARNLAARGVHVYGLLVGSREMSPDAAVEPVDFPDWIYSGDTIRPRALIRLDGLAGKNAQVELRRDGQMVGQPQQMRAASGHELIPFDFTDKPPASDKVLEYEIKVSQMPGEVNTQNNVATFRVAVKKDKLAALVVEDRPRWEFRYLAGYLSQRQGFKLQTVLMQPATIQGIAQPVGTVASPDNPRTEAQRLPETLEGWEKFDLIVLGDVGPDVLTPQMQQFIAAAVRDKGATVIAIAGQRSMPSKYAQSSLAEILPITLNPQWTADQISRHTRSGFKPQTAPTAGMSVLASLGADMATNSRAWQAMPDWYWHSAFTDAKPAASVIWAIPSAGPAVGDDATGTIAAAQRHAMLATMTIGLGHSLYLASDQTWRLRQVGGLNLHDRFWGQVLNWAVGSDLPAGGKYVRFGTNQPTYEQTQPVVVTARVLKDDLTPYTGLSFSAVARAAGGAGGGGGVVEARFSPMDSPGYYQATLAGLPIGSVEISLKGTEVERLLETDPTVTLKTLLIKVYPTLNAERQNMNTDADLLERVARMGAGFSVDAPYADVLLSRMPRIEHKETTVYQLGLFTDPNNWWTYAAHWGFFGLFVLLITVEWIVRKLAGLV